MASKKDLSERDICTKYILPALKKAGWDIETQIREEVSFTDGRIYVRGDKTTRGKRKRADFILYYKPHMPIAIIEAKSNKLSVNAGIQQGIEYANILDIPVVYSSNGDAFYEHDKTLTSGKIEKEILLNKYANEGIENIESLNILQVQPFNKIGSPLEIIKLFGGKKQYLNAVIELENELYKAA